MKDEKSNEISIALNRLAREQMKFRILVDVKTDLAICNLEGWDWKAYLDEIKELIDGIRSPISGRTNEQK